VEFLGPSYTLLLIHASGPEAKNVLSTDTGAVPSAAYFRVPAGTVLYLPLTHLALSDPRFAQQHPEAFLPERMMTPEGLKQGAQIPFGHGPRCVGDGIWGWGWKDEQELLECCDAACLQQAFDVMHDFLQCEWLSPAE
jgi:hypothetical protein